MLSVRVSEKGTLLYNLSSVNLSCFQAEPTRHPVFEMESMEGVPMTTRADARGEDTETHLYGLGGSGDAEANAAMRPSSSHSQRT